MNIFLVLLQAFGVTFGSEGFPTKAARLETTSPILFFRHDAQKNTGRKASRIPTASDEAMKNPTLFPEEPKNKEFWRSPFPMTLQTHLYTHLFGRSFRAWMFGNAIFQGFRFAPPLAMNGQPLRGEGQLTFIHTGSLLYSKDVLRKAISKIRL